MKNKIKIISTIMIFAMLVGCGNNTAITTDYEEESQEAYEIARIKKTQNENGHILIEETEYNEKGDKTKFVRYAKDEIVFECEYEYDRNGKLIKETSISVTDDNPGIYTIGYKYDKKGNMVEKKEEGSEFKKVTKIKYDKKGNMIAQESNTSGKGIGSHSVKYEWKYDKNGNVTEEMQKVDQRICKNSWEYNDNGQLIKEYIRESLTKSMEYDSNGVMIKETEYGEDGSVRWEMEYDSVGERKHLICCDMNGNIYEERTYENEYDSNGKINKSTEFKIEGDIKKISREFKYNENKILTEEFIYQYNDDTPEIIAYTEYDDNGNCKKRENYNSDGSVRLEEYEYDSKGNITKQSISTDGSVYYEEKYEYEYRE